MLTWILRTLEQKKFLSLVVMIGVAALISAFAMQFTHWSVASSIGLLFFWTWGRVNFYAATSGLVKANLHGYFVARRAGLSHDESLERMVRSRFRFFWKNGPEIAELVLASVPTTLNPEEQVLNAILQIFSVEQGHPTFEMSCLLQRIALVQIDRHSRKFGIPVA